MLRLNIVNLLVKNCQRPKETDLCKELEKHSCLRVSMGWWLLRLSAKISTLLRLSVKFFQLRLTKKLKINFFCFKELNINKPVFFF